MSSGMYKKIAFRDYGTNRNSFISDYPTLRGATGMESGPYCFRLKVQQFWVSYI